ncbi:MAG: ferredoxin--nitrite reductase [Chloroflexi bacterium]|nr:ferredoxin--nitrite reductase [Chloroflexota bacterium]
MTTHTPVPIVRGVKTIEEKLKMDYSKGVLPYIPEEVDDFETEATRYLNGEWPSEAEFIMYRLVRGGYGQRQPDVQMMRIKVPGGAMTADQMDAFGELVSKYAPLKKGHVTTRENIQVHFVKLDDTPHVMRILGEAGLVTREACGNTVRNVAGDPLSGVKPEEPFYVAPYLTAYARYFVRHEYTQVLPRKWKTAFCSGGDDEVVADIHDLAFIPKIKDGEKGFEIRIGGGTSIMPRTAWVLSEFTPVSEYLKIAEAAIRVFHRTDELRKNKMRARIKFYVDRIGIEAFKEEVDKELKGDWAKADFDPTPWMELPPEMIDEPPALIDVDSSHIEPDFLKWKKTNTLAQQQEGYYVVYVTLPLGDISEAQFPLLSDAARKYAGGRIRLTTEQNLVYRWVPEGHLHAFWSDLKKMGLSEDGANQITDVVSCPGTDSCKMGITSSMGVASALRETLRQSAFEDPMVNSLHVKVSGCPNGCSRHHIANIGFHGAATKGDGNQVPAYEVFLAGNYGNQDPVRFGHRVKAKVPAKRVPLFMNEIISFYQDNRSKEEPFNDFVDRVGTEPFERLADQFRDVGSLNKENLDTYMDWGKTILYKIERGEGECAV